MVAEKGQILVGENRQTNEGIEISIKNETGVCSMKTLRRSVLQISREYSEAMCCLNRNLDPDVSRQHNLAQEE